MPEQNQQGDTHKQSRLQRAMEAYGEQISGVLEGDDTAPEELKAGDLSAKFNVFAALADPSHETASQHKYLDWICRVYLQQAEQGDPIKAEDLSKIWAELCDFQTFSVFFDDISQRDINNYESYGALLDQLRPYQQARDAKKAARSKISDEIEATTITVYEGPEGKIVRPLSMEACQFWGMGTKWCISASKSDNAFWTYYQPEKGKHVYIYLPATVSEAERQRFPDLSNFKYAGAGDGLWDELDKEPGYIAPALGRLIEAAETAEQTLEKDHLREHGQYEDKVRIPYDPEDWDDPGIMLPLIKREAKTAIFSTNKDLLYETMRYYNGLLKESTEKLFVDWEQMKSRISELMPDRNVVARALSRFSASAVDDEVLINNCFELYGTLVSTEPFGQDEAFRQSVKENASEACGHIRSREAYLRELQQVRDNNMRQSIMDNIAVVRR